MLEIKDIFTMEHRTPVTVTGLIKTFEVKQTATGVDYIDIKLSDSISVIPAKMWSAEQIDILCLEDARFVQLEGEVGEFKGFRQVIFHDYTILDEDEVNVQDYIRTAPESVKSMVDYLEDCLNSIEDRVIREVVSIIWEKNKDKFIEFPAARSHHHDYPTGLLYHTVSMLRLAKNNIVQYQGKLDKDIMYGAIILHDMDKVREYTGTENTQYTELGKLYGHIFMSAAETYHEIKMLYEKNPHWDYSKVNYLIHAILAHHGKLEWGSPVVPQTIEAEIVHQIDMMDSRISSSKWER